MGIVLVEGLFTEEDSLSLIKDATEGLKLEDENLELEQWSLIIPDDSKSTHIIRFFPSEKKKNLEVSILKNDKWYKTKAKWDGKYLVFDTEGNNIKFRILDSENFYIKFKSLLILIILFITSLLIIYIKKTKKLK